MLAFLALLGFAQLAYAQFDDTDSFSLLMQGTCVQINSSTGSCSLKGNSQTIQTLISPSDALVFTVKPHLGSYAHVTFTYQTDSSDGISIQGNMTFGTHTARDHTIVFESHGEVTSSKDAGFSASAGRITDGLGVYDGYEGIITIAGGSPFSARTTAIALVSGHIWEKPSHVGGKAANQHKINQA